MHSEYFGHVLEFMSAFASASVLFPSSFSSAGFYYVGFNEADGDMVFH